MLNIVLLCAGGASTGMLAVKMQKVAEEVKFPANIKAGPIGMASSVAKEADVVLLGPQVGYRLKEIQKTLPSKPVMTINSVDYGQMKAKKILKDAIKCHQAFKKNS